MIREFTVENFKSMESLTLPLGRVTVLIGENGAGKSNILEAMAFFGAAVQDKLDPEFLYARGVRISDGKHILSAFDGRPKGWRKSAFHLICQGKQNEISDLVIHDSSKSHYGDASGWGAVEGPPNDAFKILSFSLPDENAHYINSVVETAGDPIPGLDSEDLNIRAAAIMIKGIRRARAASAVGKRLMPTPFVIFSPENTALRAFETEGQLRPLGVRGEGLFRLVQQFAEKSSRRFSALRQELKIFDWFSDLSMPTRLGVGESRLDIKDRFLAAKRLIDQRSANEGFLFVLFYLCLFLSPQTPKCFAIDNIDASLNPKLCAELMRRLVVLAKKEDKQVVITTHNPAILDGLDLHDQEQVLYAVQRNDKGRTTAQRIQSPKPQPGEPALKLSHAYLRGLLGGVPKNF